LARFFSFTETDDGAQLLLLDGGAGVAGGLSRWVEWVLGMVATRRTVIDEEHSIAQQS